MITYLPFPEFMRSADALDDERLDKQIDYVVKLIKIMEADPKNNSENRRARREHHLLISMWEGHERQLANLGLAYCHVWRISRRHHEDIRWGFIGRYATELKQAEWPNEKPPWIGDRWVHASHQAGLRRFAKANGSKRLISRYYSLFPKAPIRMPYIWPQLLADGEGYRLRMTEADAAAWLMGELVLPKGLTYDCNKREVLAS